MSKSSNLLFRKPLLLFLLLSMVVIYRACFSIKNFGEVENAIMDYANSWLGTPHLLGGESKKGIDCSGLTRKVYKEVFDISLPRSSALQIKEGRKVSRKKLDSGDLIFFTAQEKKGRINHSGIYLSRDRFLHTSTTKGVTVSILTEEYWDNRFKEGRRILHE